MKNKTSKRDLGNLCSEHGGSDKGNASLWLKPHQVFVMQSHKLTEAEEARRGKLLAEELKLKRGRDKYWNTTWGQKTDLGLYRMAKWILDGEIL